MTQIVEANNASNHEVYRTIISARFNITTTQPLQVAPWPIYTSQGTQRPRLLKSVVAKEFRMPATKSESANYCCTGRSHQNVGCDTHATRPPTRPPHMIHPTTGVVCVRQLGVSVPYWAQKSPVTGAIERNRRVNRTVRTAAPVNMVQFLKFVLLKYLK